MAKAPNQTKAKKDKLPLLSLLTYSPVGNSLLELSAGQRNLFFEYLLMSLHSQRKEQLVRTAALGKRVVLPTSLAGLAMNIRGKRQQEGKIRLAERQEEQAKAKTARQEASERKKSKADKQSAVTGSGAAAQAQKAGIFQSKEETKAQSLAGMVISPILEKNGKGEKSQGEEGSGTPGSSFFSAFGQKAQTASAAVEQLALVINDYSRGDAIKEKRVVNDLHSRVRSQSYKADDIMASLLLVIEDDVWSGEEGGVGSTKPQGGATRLASLVPQKLRTSARDSAEVRLASVREMLRYYFLAHPEDYQAALAAALGITADQEGDIAFLQERLAYLLASIGAFALAQKILAELKKKKKMDTKECLMRLGYRYDTKGRRLIVGKRTCGKPAEARGIIGLLLESMRGRSAF